MKLSKKDRKLVNESIEHWYRISACKTLEALDKEGYYCESCALCKEYIDLLCKGCPIALKTGQSACYGSPWYNAAESLEDWECGAEWTSQDQANIEAEIRFLESLLEDK